MHVHAASRHFLTHLTKANQGNSKSENDVTVKKIVVYIFRCDCFSKHMHLLEMYMLLFSC